MIGKFGCLIACLLGCALCVTAQDVEFNGQLSGWLLWDEGAENSQLGARYMPEVSITTHVSEKWSIDAMLSADGYAYYPFDQDVLEEELEADLYRAWLRLSNPQMELRLGLQKINFGPAVLLRSIMWFDAINPQDPLQLTDGVKGLLFRYYFLNNANLWLWALYPNDEPKGWETVPSNRHTPEWGGRLQFPAGSGEMALTVHLRELADSPIPDLQPGDCREERIALDGKWDIEIGAWLELALVHQDSDLPGNYQGFATLGLDYTINTGNGLHLLAEHLVYQYGDRPLQGERLSLTALSADYPLDLLHSLQISFYYDWENQETYRFVQFQRIQDSVGFYVIGFWNPEDYRMLPYQDTGGAYAGLGLQFMVVWNH